MAKKRTSPWLYFGCGCVALVGLAVAAVIATGIFGFSIATDYIDDLKDPASRTERALGILRAEEMPTDYHALLFFKIPWVLDAVILTDAPPPDLNDDELEDFEPMDSRYLGDHLFMYIALHVGGEDIDSVFEGRGKPGEVQFDMGSSFDSEEELSRGEVEIGDGKLNFTIHRGDLTTEDGERLRGIYSEMHIDCSGDDTGRLALWFLRDSEGTDPDTPPDLPGTPGDEEAIRDFMGHFDLCDDRP